MHDGVYDALGIDELRPVPARLHLTHSRQPVEPTTCADPPATAQNPKPPPPDSEEILAGQPTRGVPGAPVTFGGEVFGGGNDLRVVTGSAQITFRDDATNLDALWLHTTGHMQFGLDWNDPAPSLDVTVQSSGTMELDLPRSVADRATIKNARGDVRLISLGGDILVGYGHKITAAQGDAILQALGGVVRVMDVNGIHVGIGGAAIQIIKRPRGNVLLPNLNRIADHGVEIIGPEGIFLGGPVFEINAGGPDPVFGAMPGSPVVGTGDYRVERFNGMPRFLAVDGTVLDLALSHARGRGRHRRRGAQPLPPHELRPILPSYSKTRNMPEVSCSPRPRRHRKRLARKCPCLAASRASTSINATRKTRTSSSF